MSSSNHTPRPDPYAILGIHHGATAEEIRRAYRRKTKATHPDRSDRIRQPDEWRKANQEQAELNRAYAALRSGRAGNATMQSATPTAPGPLRTRPEPMAGARYRIRPSTAKVTLACTVVGGCVFATWVIQSTRSVPSVSLQSPSAIAPAMDLGRSGTDRRTLARKPAADKDAAITSWQTSPQSRPTAQNWSLPGNLNYPQSTNPRREQLWRQVDMLFTQHTAEQPWTTMPPTIMPSLNGVPGYLTEPAGLIAPSVQTYGPLPQRMDILDGFMPTTQPTK